MERSSKRERLHAAILKADNCESSLSEGSFFSGSFSSDVSHFSLSTQTAETIMPGQKPVSVSAETAKRKKKTNIFNTLFFTGAKILFEG